MTGKIRIEPLRRRKALASIQAERLIFSCVLCTWYRVMQQQKVALVGCRPGARVFVHFEASVSVQVVILCIFRSSKHADQKVKLILASTNSIL